MDYFIDQMLNGQNGNRADDFYFKYNKRGAKIFYSRITSKRLAKSSIPKGLLHRIQEHNPGLDVGELGTLKEGYLKEITRLQGKIDEINIKLSQINVHDDETTRQFQNEKVEEDRKTQRRKEEYKRESDESTRRFFEEFRSYFQRSEQSDPNPDVGKSKSFLKSLNINTKKEWHNWLRRNHPDKGGTLM